MPCQKGKKVKSETTEVIINKFMQNIILICLRCAIWEKIINIIAISKYQNTPCPICWDPTNETLKLFAKKLDKTPVNAKENGIIIKGWSKFFNSYLSKKSLPDK